MIICTYGGFTEPVSDRVIKEATGLNAEIVKAIIHKKGRFSHNGAVYTEVESRQSDKKYNTPRKIIYCISKDGCRTGTREEISKFLGVHTSTIYNLIRKKSLYKKQYLLSDKLEEFPV